MDEWIVMRDGLRYVVAQCVQRWCLGSCYRFHCNEKRRVTRFWLRKSAERFASKLNGDAE